MNGDLFGPAEEARRVLGDVGYQCLRDVATLRQDDLPGIQETVYDNILVNVSRPHRGRIGFFAPEGWELENHPVSEINFSTHSSLGNPDVSRAEEVLDTLLQELADAHAFYNGINDTSNRGRYHNRRFGEIALALGLNVVRVKDARGHATAGISPRYRDEYNPLIASLEKALVFGARVQRAVRTIIAVGDEPEVDGSAVNLGDDAVDVNLKYVFASCTCRLGHGRPRMIRVAAGSWIAGTVLCSVCNNAFATESQPQMVSPVPTGHIGTQLGFVANGSRSARPTEGNVS